MRNGPVYYTDTTRWLSLLCMLLAQGLHIRPETPSCQFSCIAVPLAVQTSRVEDARSTPATPGHYTLTIHLKGQVGKHSRPNHLPSFATLATRNRWRFHRAQRDTNRIRTNCTRRLLEARCHYFPISVHSRTPERVSTRRHWAHRAEGGANRSLLSNSSNIHNIHASTRSDIPWDIAFANRSDEHL